MKYIVYNHEGNEAILVFPDFVSHDSIKPKRSIISAGFVGIEYRDDPYGKKATPYCYGRSDSLNINSRKDDDSILAQILFREADR